MIWDATTPMWRRCYDKHKSYRMAINWQRTFSNTSFCMKMIIFWFKFHWRLSVSTRLTNHWIMREECCYRLFNIFVTQIMHFCVAVFSIVSSLAMFIWYSSFRCSFEAFDTMLTSEAVLTFGLLVQLKEQTSVIFDTKSTNVPSIKCI